MRKTLIALALAVAACSPEPAAVPEPTPPPAPAPAPAPEPAPAPAPAPKVVDDYGDDPTLDRLWDRCANDVLDACDELYWESPLNSRYEAYALDRIDEITAGTPITEDEVIDLFGVDMIMDLVWADMSRQERDDLCGGVILFGADVSAAIVVDASGMDLPVDEVAGWLTETCGL